MGKKQQGRFGALKDQATAWAYDLAMSCPTWVLKAWIGLNVLAFVILEFTGLVPGMNFLTNTILDEVVQMLLTAPAIAVLSDRGHLDKEVSELVEEINPSVEEYLLANVDLAVDQGFLLVPVEDIRVSKRKPIKAFEKQALLVISQRLMEHGEWTEVEMVRGANEKFPSLIVKPSNKLIERVRGGVKVLSIDSKS